MSTASKSTLGKKHSHAAAHDEQAVATRPVQPTGYFRWKAILDRVAAALLLLPGLPIMAVLAILVRLTSRGPAVYRQRRVGLKGRVFSLYKFRSMRQDAEAHSGAVWAQAHDPRVTPLGRILRRLHLDELPQLFNVLKGEMSLVGPRPERPEFVQVLSAAIPGYLNRIEVAPGITGLAQLNLPPDSDLDSVRRKLALDLEYIQRAGLLLDIRLFLATCARVVKLPEGLVLRVLRVGRTVMLPAQNSPTNGKNETNGHGHATAASLAVATKAVSLLAKGEGPQDGDGRRGQHHDVAYPTKPR
jgi:lipopolysaccharide/colanic/teichoic acid biosynthesis glycosyltransferase